MKPVQAFLAVGTLLLLGIAIGAAGVVVAGHFVDLGAPIRDLHRDSPDLDRLIEHLELTRQQSEELDAILRSAAQEVQAIHDELLPRVHEHLEHTHAQIDAILEPEQRAKFDDFHRRHRVSMENIMLHLRRYGQDPHPHP